LECCFTGKGAALLILANKQDLPGAMTVQEVENLLDLQHTCSDKSYHIQPTIATVGDGLEDGFSWLCGSMKRL
jgi:signal recognition particle receptor subunit beta